MPDGRLVFSLLLMAAGCNAVAKANDPEALAARRGTPEIPEALAVPAGHKLAFAADASGFQVYVCAAGPEAHGTPAYGWTLKAPDAKLFDKRGQQIGTHFAGPTWQAVDGSSVVAKRVEGHSVGPDSIPWLLLQAASNTGHGLMSKVTFIQRLATSGGIAPSSGCDRSSVDQTRSVAYTAKYYFYEAASPKVRGHSP